MARSEHAGRVRDMLNMSEYHPEHPGRRRQGRTVKCPLFPFDELGVWTSRVTVGWQLRGKICMSELSLGRKAPNGVGPEELARRTISDERGSGQTLVGVLHKDRLDPGVEPRA